MTNPLGMSMPGCFFCVDNKMLAFGQLTTPELAGYAIPGSKAVVLEGHERPIMTPLPYIYLIAPKTHPAHTDEFGGIWPDGWTTAERELMRLLHVGGGYNISENRGTAFGQRPVGASTDHLFKWVITNRHLVLEVPSDKPNVLNGTSELGFATQVHQSRQAARSIPDDSTLAQWWLDAQARHTGVDAWRRYNDRVDAWRFNDH